MNPERKNFSSTAFLPTALLIRILKRETGWTWATMQRITGVHESLLYRYAKGTAVPSPATLDRILTRSGIPADPKETILAAMKVLGTAFSGVGRVPSTSVFTELLTESGDAVQLPNGLADPSVPLPAPDPSEQLGRLLSCDPGDRLHVARIAMEFHSFPLCLLCCGESLRHAATEPTRARELAELAQEIADQLFQPSSFARPGCDAEAEAYAAAAGEAARALDWDYGSLFSDWVRARALVARRQRLPARELLDRVRRELIARVWTSRRFSPLWS